MLRTVRTPPAGLLALALLPAGCSSGVYGKSACRAIPASRSAAIALYTTGSTTGPDVQPLKDATALLTRLGDKGALDAARAAERDLAAALASDARSTTTGQPSTPSTAPTGRCRRRVSCP